MAAVLQNGRDLDGSRCRRHFDVAGVNSALEIVLKYRRSSTSEKKEEEARGIAVGYGRYNNNTRCNPIRKIWKGRREGSNHKNEFKREIFPPGKKKYIKESFL